MTSARSRRRTRRVVRVRIAVAAIVGVCILGAVVFLGLDGRCFMVESPSMAEYAPVGTFVLSVPVAFGSLRVGDTLLFHPPGEGSRTYFHRIVSISDGVAHTKGDLNGTVDPWVVRPENVVGREVLHVVGLAFLVEALPFLIVGGVLVVIGVHSYATRPWRLPAGVFGGSLVVAVAAFVIRPFVRMIVISKTVIDGTATFTVVPTGLFDVVARAPGGSETVLRPGEIGRVTTRHLVDGGRFSLDVLPALSHPQVVVVVAVLCIPLLICGLYLVHLRRQGEGMTGIEPA